jgi:toxin ParE1/3/4
MKAIARYTFEQWGAEQAVRYARNLEICFQSLAENSRMGRACDAISSGLRRHEIGKHIVFYRLKPDGTRIVRVLHQQMIPTKSQFDK